MLCFSTALYRASLPPYCGRWVACAFACACVCAQRRMHGSVCVCVCGHVQKHMCVRVHARHVRVCMCACVRARPRRGGGTCTKSANHADQHLASSCAVIGARATTFFTLPRVNCKRRLSSATLIPAPIRLCVCLGHGSVLRTAWAYVSTPSVNHNGEITSVSIVDGAAGMDAASSSTQNPMINYWEFPSGVDCHCLPRLTPDAGCLRALAHLSTPSQRVSSTQNNSRPSPPSLPPVPIRQDVMCTRPCAEDYSFTRC